MKKIRDYLSDKFVQATPEEVEAVQPYLRKLVNVYQIPKAQIQAHPQYRLKNYFLDIAVFDDKDNLVLIVENKRKDVTSGLKQLETYLTASDCFYGVYYNGDDEIFLEKQISPTGEISFHFLTHFPLTRATQLTKRDLVVNYDLTALFNNLHRHIKIETGLNNLEIVNNLIRVLFCKIYDEYYKKEDEALAFVYHENNNKATLSTLFAAVKTKWPENFKANEEIIFDEKLSAYLVTQLQYLYLTDAKTDAIAQAFEAIIHDALKGEQGQYFTPRNVVKFILDFLPLTPGAKILDPACGTGGFLIEALNRLLAQVSTWKQKTEAAKQIYGFDLDATVAKIAKAYFSILGDSESHIFNVNSLKNADLPGNLVGTFDAIITNPPFGNKLRIKDKALLADFVLANNKETNPEILFIEQCFKWLKDGGYLAIILPEGIFANQTQRYVRQFISANFVIKTIISLSANTFKPNTGIKSSVLICQKATNWANTSAKERILNETVNLFQVEKVGKDKNGKPVWKSVDGAFVLDEELTALKNDYLAGRPTKHFKTIKYRDILTDANLTFYVNYYFQKQAVYPDNYIVKTVAELINEGVFAVTSAGGLLTGKNPPSQFYVKKDVAINNPDNYVKFVRTSDLEDYTLNLTSQWYLEKTYFLDTWAQKQNLQLDDAIFVKEGDNKIGSFALIEETDLLVQSHFFIFRCLPNQYGLTGPALAYLFATNKAWQEQVRQAIFVQGTIPTISQNIYQLKLGFPNDKQELQKMAAKFRTFLDKRKAAYDELK